MPKRYDSCVKKVRARIKSGKIPKYYKANGVKKSSEYAICSRLRASGRKDQPVPLFSGKDFIGFFNIVGFKYNKRR